MTESITLLQENAASKPLCVDLDGSLIRSDMLHDNALTLAKHHPFKILALPLWLLRGKAYMKQRIAELTTIDASHLPYNEELLTWLRQEKANGRRLVLATASNAKHAHAVADELQIFDEVLASNAEQNLSGPSKADALSRKFGDHGFQYVGNSSKDLAVWRASDGAVVVGSRRLAEEASKVTSVNKHIGVERASLKIWIKQLRLYQWLKNLLVLLPLIGAHRWNEPDAISLTLIAVLSFGLSASAVYVLNDLLDLDSDRRHPRKRRRPLAAGLISVPAAVAVSILLFVASLLLAAQLGINFLLWIVVYLVVTTAYSLKLKQIALIDCLTLAGLYTLRMVGGGAAIDQQLSFWLLAFSMFLFLSLAFVKRYAEMVSVVKLGNTTAHGRGYRVDDQPLLQMIGLTAGFSAALVMALYLNSTEILALYRHPALLWFTLPVLLYWICRVWLLASRDEMHDDPIVFAVRDPASMASGILFIAILWIAT